MKIGQPIEQEMFRIFLSSGDDAADLRDRVEALVHDAINPQLLEAQMQIRLEVDRWEKTAAQRAHPGKNTNDLFVQRALESNLTMALLQDRVGDGTREELEAALAAETEVSALWFVPRDSEPDSEVARFLTPHKQTLYYDKTGAPDSDESWLGITRILFGMVLTALGQRQEGLRVERR
jgi:hypothetical protein